MAGPRKSLDPDYLFNIFKLNKWFAISSVFLLISVLAMVKNDYDREWKSWQRKFRTLDIQKTKASLTETQEALAANPELQAATEALQKAEEEARKQEAEAFKLSKEIKRLEGDHFRSLREYQDKKSILDALRYELEEARIHNAKDVKSLQKQFDRVQAEVDRAKRVNEGKEKDFRAVEEQLKQLGESKRLATEEVGKQKQALALLERKLDLIGRSFVNDVFRDAPLLDFIDPSLKVKEIIVRDLYVDYNFTKIPRVDSCTTCHVAIDRKGFENEANPLKTHPNLETFLGSASAHPIGSFGCTVCHGGHGEGITFTNAAHTPSSPQQAKEWEEKYHWHQHAHWTEPMLALPQTEATCYGCHQKDIDIPGSKTLDKGIELVEHYGCYGCHKIQGWENVRKSGPTLKRITGKVTPDWMFKWIHNPKEFRPTTNMPRFFDLSNTSDKYYERRNKAEVRAIQTYLIDKSQPYEAAAFSLAGANPAKGLELFGSVGCLGCHVTDDFPKVKPPVFGPDLSQVGSKLSANWIAAWIRNPKEYWPDTRMPSLRLADSEVRDITAYLLSKRNEAFEAKPVPPVDRQMLTEITLEYLKKRMPESDALAKLRAMSDQERQLYMGEKLITRYGCFGCHEISGFEDAKPIGTELTYEASKPLAQFDFAFTDIDRTVPAYVHQKLIEPRIFDHGRIRDPQDKLRMPNFYFSSEEADAITTFVMGLRRYAIPEHRKPKDTRHTIAAREGRRAVHNYNCRGCHIIEGKGGQILAQYEDPSLGPPNLIGEGRKVQPPWLFEFLHNPTPIRPWLKVRMPTFGFTDQQKNTFIQYFRGLDEQSMDYETQPVIALTAEQRKIGTEVFDSLKCTKCHVMGVIPKDVETSNLAPNFQLTKNRLRYEWVDAWLRDPGKLLPGTRMPNFFYYEGQALFPDADARISAVRDHIYLLK